MLFVVGRFCSSWGAEQSSVQMPVHSTGWPKEVKHSVLQRVVFHMLYLVSAYLSGARDAGTSVYMI